MPSPSPTPDIDPDLLKRAQAGDEAAFGVIMRANYERTYRLALAIVRQEADARDVCQEAWLKVWKQLATFRGDARFTTWLYPITSRCALDHLRRRKRWFERFLPFSTGHDDGAFKVPEPTTDDDARQASESSERAAQVRAALDSLPPKHRAVLALRELEGLSYEEIAAAMNIPNGTVMSRIYHARRLLMEKLKNVPGS